MLTSALQVDDGDDAPPTFDAPDKHPRMTPPSSLRIVTQSTSPQLLRLYDLP